MRTPTRVDYSHALRPLIVIPAWNEEAAILNTLTSTRAALPDVDVLVVSDGSTDATAAMARRGGATLIELPFNLGVGGAMRTGFKYALANGYDAVVQLDADGQHQPGDVIALLDGLAAADLVVGTRFGPDRSYDVGGPRRWAMLMLSWVLSLLAGTRLDDTTSGFRATGPRLLPLYTQSYPAEYLGDTVESLMIAIRSGFCIAQCQVTMLPRQGGVPSQSPRRALLYLLRAGMTLGLSLIRRWPTVDETSAPMTPLRPAAVVPTQRSAA